MDILCSAFFRNYGRRFYYIIFVTTTTAATATTAAATASAAAAVDAITTPTTAEYAPWWIGYICRRTCCAGSLIEPKQAFYNLPKFIRCSTVYQIPQTCLVVIICRIILSTGVPGIF